jgi:ABC-type uncharacterized transport system substrate-binding protein
VIRGACTARILKGEKPGELPVLYTNLKSAKARGLKAPKRIVGRAEEVIE